MIKRKNMWERLIEGICDGDKASNNEDVILLREVYTLDMMKKMAALAELEG